MGCQLGVSLSMVLKDPPSPLLLSGKERTWRTGGPGSGPAKLGTGCPEVWHVAASLGAKPSGVGPSIEASRSRCSKFRRKSGRCGFSSVG